ncbi:LOW QUALITY PROTEIN: hypothetical protein Cgig2_000648 [Carnegiea gigantea]|uniref:Uncharacterized protein n=1 Tax=Carnegiea gigantea TaxID=171969 RepID=A0A9Q1JFH6_9CARY|nr:LOW QUALITY PROTEIN: hypothetical protein Cgig2_000648 [Carnegiea gigantea]
MLLELAVLSSVAPYAPLAPRGLGCPLASHFSHAFDQEERVKKAVEAASFARPFPRFEYVPIVGCEPSHRHAPVVSRCHNDRMREDPYANRDGRERTKTVLLGPMPNIVAAQAMDVRQRRPRPQRRMQCTPNELPVKLLNDSGLQTVVLTANAREAPHTRGMVRGHPMLKRPPPMTLVPKPHNTQKYCEFHEQNGRVPRAKEGPSRTGR